MNNKLFQSLFTSIRPRIEKKNTFIRDAESAEEKLAVTCRSSTIARFSTPGVIPQSGSATYCNSIRDTTTQTLQFAS
jgi:hypothetical protein